MAAILANLPKSQSPNPNPNSNPNAHNGPTTTTTPNQTPANPLAGLNFSQLAELAKVAQSIKSPQGAQAQPPQLPNFAGTLPSITQQVKGFVPPPQPPQQQQYGQYGQQGYQGSPPQSQGQGQFGYGADRQQPDVGREENMPPGTSRNYGRVKPLKNPIGTRLDNDGRSPLAIPDEGYQRSTSGPGPGPYINQDRQDRRESGGERAPLPPSGSGAGSRGWDRERSRSPVRRDAGSNRERDGGWGNRGKARGGGHPNQSSREGDFGGRGRQGSDQGPQDTRPPIPVRPDQDPSMMSGSEQIRGQGQGYGSRAGPVGGTGPTLDNFDMTSFNPMDPGSWSTLGEAWKRSRGTEPNQMDLMGWMQEKMMGAQAQNQSGGGMSGMNGGGWGEQGQGQGQGYQGGWQGQGGY